MKKCLFLLFAICITFTLMAKDPNGMVERRDLSSSTNLAPANPIRDPWDNLLQFDVDTPSGQTGLSGMEWDGMYFYATKWSGSNQIFKFDSEGNYIEPLTVPLTGARDLAFDGQYMYGSAASSSVYCWESQTGVAVPENNITVAGVSVRAVAYDPLTDTFWSGNFGDPISHWDRDGNVIETFANPGMDFYGMAYDYEDPDGPFLYGFHQTPGCTIVKIDPGTFEILETVDVTAQGGTGAIAGGLCYMSDWDPALRTLGALLQGTPDYICVYELGENAPIDAPAAADMFMVTPDASGALIADLGWMNPTQTVGGTNLTDLDEMRVYRNDVLIETINDPVIGGIVNTTDNPPAAGIYTYSVVGYNDAGEGIPVSGSAYIGEDVPAAVTDIVVAGVEGNGVLSWTNPTEGLHGGPFNEPIQGYHIERTDMATFEVTGLQTTWTDDTIPGDGLYGYTITPYNSIGDGGSASSEVVWIGSSMAAMFGDPNTTTTYNYAPLDFYWKNSLSQTIYYAEEFAAQGFGGGAVTGIMYYNNFAEDLTGMPVNIWMQNTNLEDLSGGWVPATNMQQVFSGTLDFPTGINEIMVGFDEPFIYEGANVIIFVERVMDTVYWNYNDVFYYTDTQYASRTLYIYSDTVDYDPYNPPATMTAVSSHPNTMMFINIEGLGSLEGYAYNQVTNEPLEGVLIDLVEQRINTFTDANGYYNFPGLFEGTYEAHATLFAHSEDVETVVIVADETTEQDFYLTPVLEVEVTGRVVGSDYPDIGLAGAEVTLDGMGVHEAITDADGYFLFDSVYNSNTYVMTVVAEGYEVLVGEAVIGAGNTDLGDVIVNEVAFPPFNVVATQNVEDTEVEVVWEAPDPSAANFWDFENDNGDFIPDTGWAWGTDAEAGAYSGTNVWGTVLGADYPSSANFSLVTPEMNIPTDDAVLTFWHWVDIESSWDGGNVKISTDGGTSWTIINPVGGYPGTAVGLGGEVCYNGYTQTWSLATFEIGAYQGEDVMFKFHFGSDSSINYRGWYIDDVFVGMPGREVVGEGNVNFRPVVSLAPRTTQRLLESYNVYSLLLEDEGNEDLWTMVGEGVMETFYTDMGWVNNPYGVYEYAVKGVYTNSVLSDPAFSNWVAKDYYTTADVSVTDFFTNPVEGAEVKLTCQDPDPDGVLNQYEIITDANGDAFFPMIWKGNYNIRVTMDNMQTYELEMIPIFAPYTLDVTMTEETNPISGLDYDVTGADVHLWWNAPSGEAFFDFEADDGEFISNAGTGWMWGVDATLGVYSGAYTWVTNTAGNYANSANWQLVSPELPIPGEGQLSFWHNYSTESYYDGGNVKISIDGGATWQIITPDGGYPEDAATTSNSGIPGEPCYSATSGAWLFATFDLTMYEGEDAMFMFHFGSDSSVNGYPGWAIDDVRVGAPLDRDERILESYNIYRDGALIDNVDVEEYYDFDLANATYTYGVGALYTTGESEIVEVMVDVYPVDITGFVTKSDTPDTEPLAGAMVTLENDMFLWEALSDAAGNFLLEDVNGNMTYTITVSYEGYQSWSEEVAVGGEDINYPLIILLEMINPPSGVLATVNQEDTECDLIWNTPGAYPEYEIIYDDDVFENATAWYLEGEERAVWFTAQGGPCMVTGGSMNIYNGTWPAGNILTPFTIYVWAYDAGTGLPGEVLGSVVVTPTDYNWVPFVFDTPIPVSGTEFFLGYAQGGAYPDCAPVAIDETLPVVNRSYEHTVSAGTPWVISGYQDFMIRATVEGPTGREFTISHDNPIVNLSNAPVPDGSITEHAYIMPQGKMTVGNASYIPVHNSNPFSQLSNVNNSRDRELVGYNVFVGEWGDEANYEMWNQVNTAVIPDTFYTDMDWVDYMDGYIYVYAVRSVYTNDNMSGPAFSNWIGKNMYATLDVTLTTNGGVIPAGAEVTLEATVPDPEGNYPEYMATTNAFGECTFTNVWKGNYNLTASLENYTDLEDNIDIVETFETYAGMLIEILYQPIDLAVDEDGMLTWDLGIGGGPTGSILFVDDDGSIDIGHTDTYPYYEIILNAYGSTWDYYEIELAPEDGPDAAFMSDYDLVIWECGEQWTGGNTLTINDEAALATYLDGGGHLILNAFDYLWDRYSAAGAFTAGQFPYDYLGLASANQDMVTVSGTPIVVDGAGCTAGMTLSLQDIYTTVREGIYVDYLTPNAMGSSYTTYSGNNIGIQTTNAIFTCANWPGLMDDVDTVADYTSASIDYLLGGMRPLEYFNIYIDDGYVGQTTDYFYDLTTIPGLINGEDYTVGVSTYYTSGYESPISTIVFTCTWDSYLYGDVTGDNVVDAFDAANLLQYTVGMNPVGAPLPWTWQMIAGNVSGDQYVDAYDAALVLQYSVGMIDIFPVEAREVHERPIAELAISQAGNELIITAQGELHSFLLDLNMGLSNREIVFNNEDALTCVNGSKMALASALPINGEICRISLTDAVNLIGTEISGTVNEIDFTVHIDELPEVTSLNAIYPNPFNPVTNIKFSLCQTENVKITVYNLKGQKVAVIHNDELAAGNHTISWNAQDTPSGIYFLNFHTDSANSTQKVVLLK
ncbi:MAG: carboxypeptidase regulatory-like domain-containing protein [Candidatus Cloacimonetes bacterium]|nr:carboxypeptidase regulatory-like domain-containing protein [Candidatus Cloacimonadota bacterium]